MNLKPIGDRVVIKSEFKEEKTEGGIILPSKEKEKNVFATVVAVGNGTNEVKMEVKEGDKVIYTRYSGTEVEIDKEKYIILSQSDILAVID